MTIDEHTKVIDRDTKIIIAENPGITSVWWEINNVPVADLKAFAESRKEEMDTDRCTGRLRVIVNIGKSVIVVRSVPVKARVVWDVERNP